LLKVEESSIGSIQGTPLLFQQGEEHTAYNDHNEVCEIVWVLVG